MADTRGTILIVDDEPATIELLSDYLGGKWLAVACAHSLGEALAELDSERPDAVLISLRLGEADGLEQAALAAMQRGVGGEKAEVIRALNQVRNMIRFAHGPGDISAETAGRLDEHMARARRSVGLS
jgi:CheY-like chemotaxis protein